MHFLLKREYISTKTRRVYGEAVPNGEGTMAAVFGLDREKFAEVTNEVTESGSVQLANINCPGQIVISGTGKGVELAGMKAKEAGRKRVLPLEVSGPFHSELNEASC